MHGHFLLMLLTIAGVDYFDLALCCQMANSFSLYLQLQLYSSLQKLFQIKQEMKGSVYCNSYTCSTPAPLTLLCCCV